MESFNEVHGQSEQDARIEYERLDRENSTVDDNVDSLDLFAVRRADLERIEMDIHDEEYTSKQSRIRLNDLQEKREKLLELLINDDPFIN